MKCDLCAPAPCVWLGMTDITLEALLAQVRSCTACLPDLPHGARPVVQLSEDARILIVGQAPGAKVHASGIPFDDASGDRLRSWMGIDRDIFYSARKIAILPMGFCYPGTGQSGDLPPRPECAPLWRQRLLDHLPNIKLTLVIGAYAINWHLPEQRHNTLTAVVKNWRGYWPHVLPLPHPSPRNNIWLKKNSWFEDTVIPQLKDRIHSILI